MDWIDTFLDLTERSRAPKQFRLWAAIGTLAAILERRVWSATDHSTRRLYPNQYCVLAGPPGSGKTTMVRLVHDLLSEVNGLHIGPDNPTRKSFLEFFEGAQRIPQTNGTGPMIYLAMTLLCREFGVLFPRRETQMLDDLSDLWENLSRYTVPRSTTKSVTLENPTLNILAGVTPSYLGEFIPETAWGQGFTSRIIFIYGEGAKIPDRKFIGGTNTTVDYSPLVKFLRSAFHELVGEFQWELAAELEANSWINAGQPPTPDYGRLQFYNERRDMHFGKLAMISAVSAGRNLVVTLSDVNRAREWLLDAEKLMPDVFLAMMQKSDSQLLDDLHRNIYALWSRVARNERKDIHEREIYKFLDPKVPAERIPRIIDQAEKTGRLVRGTLPGYWRPENLEKSTGVRK